MKKIVLTFGLLSGGVSTVMMYGTLPFLDRIGFDKGEILGYTGIVLSFLFVFFGVRSYRESLGGAPLTFGNAFGVGILITLISCVCYVIAWEFLYYFFMPDFGQKYTAHLLEQLRASGATEAAIDAKAKEMADFMALYANPAINAAITFIEPFPVGLLMTVISAATLRRK